MRKCILIVCILFTLANEMALSSATSNQLVIKFRDATSDSLIEDVHAYLEFFNNDTGEVIKTMYYVREQLTINLNSGFWEMKIILDDISTKGKDYFYKGSINLTQDSLIAIYAYPIGSIRGTVYDKNGKVITDAIINFECSNNWGETTQTYTNSFGSFSSNYLPIGSCKVTARSGSVIGYKIVEIKRGEHQDIEITLEKEVATNYRFLFLIVISVFIFFLFAKFEKRKSVTRKRKASRRKVKLNKRMEDIIKTLNERERKIVNFLLSEKEEASQAKIYHSLEIPKASLSRAISSLERRKIVKTKKIGKLKKIKLSEWLLRG
jgi:uncharacterized membrane protein